MEVDGLAGTTIGINGPGDLISCQSSDSPFYLIGSQGTLSRDHTSSTLSFPNRLLTVQNREFHLLGQVDGSFKGRSKERERHPVMWASSNLGR